MMPYKRSERGFTLVEMMLAMSFLSMLLLAITMSVMQMSSIFARGETVRQINQAARLISTDFQRTIGPSDLSAIDMTRINGYGRLCTGQYSYIWNQLKDDGVSQKFPGNVYNSGDRKIRFIRVVDQDGQYCKQPNNAIVASATPPVEMLPEGDRSLMVHQFDVNSGHRGASTKEQLLNFRILLGTSEAKMINTASGSCRPPDEIGKETAYCAVNELRFTILAGLM